MCAGWRRTQFDRWVCALLFVRRGIGVRTHEEGAVRTVRRDAVKELIELYPTTGPPCTLFFAHSRAPGSPCLSGGTCIRLWRCSGLHCRRGFEGRRGHCTASNASERDVYKRACGGGLEGGTLLSASQMIVVDTLKLASLLSPPRSWRRLAFERRPGRSAVAGVGVKAGITLCRATAPAPGSDV